MAAADVLSYKGRRLLPVVLDAHAATNPDRLYAVIPKTADVKDGLRDISVADLARCANCMAQWIEERFGRSDSFETLSYIGLNDLRGIACFLAAVKCGYKILFFSPRNPPATNVYLMRQTGSTKLLYAAEIAPLAKLVEDPEYPIRKEVIPSFEEMMTSSPPHYPYTKTFEEAKNDPIVVLHSSGSTGAPKAITMTHYTFSTLDNEPAMPNVPGREKRDSSKWNFEGEARIFTIFPFFHLGGFVFFTVNSIFRNASPVIPPPHMVPDGTLLKEILKQQKIRAMFLVPAVIEELLFEPNGIRYFKDLDFLAYSGAPSSPAVGDRLSKVVELLSPFGSTETLIVPELALPWEDWAWHEFNPLFKHEMQLLDADEGTYELVLVCDDDMKDINAVYHNLPGVGKYHTKDLFVRHPTRPTLYKYYGRRDDIIVLANGEKFNPMPLEMHVRDQSSLKGTLVIGNGRTQAVLLVEPAEPLDEAAKAEMVETLWPLVEEANALVPSQGRIAKNKIICAASDKPFARTGKGTVVRKLTEQAYKDEIKALDSDAPLTNGIFNGIDNMGLEPSLKPVYERATVIGFLRRVLTAASFAAGATVGEDDDFFAYGLDSVQSIEITANLKRTLRAQVPKTVSVDWITPRTIFHNPSLADLSRLLTAFLNEGIIPNEDRRLTRARAVDEVVERYTQDLPARPAQATPAKMSAVAVIGTTGYLGGYLVASLLKDAAIQKVFCLNRSGDAEEKQKAALTRLDKALEPHLHKLVYFKVALGQPRLGLGEEEYQTLVDSVDAVAYNAWRLDFGLSIRTFDPFLRATRDLVDLAAASRRNMRILFVSSVSAVHGMDTAVPEAPVEDALAALDNGYGQSKLAAERILAAANEQAGIPVSIARVCQVGGPSAAAAGTWADQPWISALLRTSKALRALPSPFAPLDWVPVDVVAAMLHRFLLQQPVPAGAQVFNVYPPKPQPWEALVDALRESAGISSVIPWSDWIRRLQGIRDPTPEDVAKYPALKLLDFYSTLTDGTREVKFATDHARSVSQVDIPTLDRDTIQSWLQDWGL